MPPLRRRHASSLSILLVVAFTLVVHPAVSQVALRWRSDCGHVSCESWICREEAPLLPAAPAATRTWSGLGGSDLWSEAANWSGGVPVDNDDIQFGASARTSSVNDFAALSLQSIAFAADAPAYQLSIKGGGAVAPKLTLTGSGIGNASGILQNLRVGAGQARGDRGAVLEFRNGATVAANIRITNGSVTFDSGGTGIDPSGMTQFRENSSAGSGVFFNEGSVTGTLPGGRLQFFGNSNAGSASITNDAGQFFPGLR